MSFHDFCSGCGLCHDVYGIYFSKDSKGFYYPCFEGKTYEEKQMSSICPFGKNGVEKYSGTVWGSYKKVFQGWSTDEELRFKASSGGTVSALAAYLLEHEIVDGIIQVKTSDSEQYSTDVVCSKTVEAVFSCSGSRYCQSSPLYDISSILADGEKYCFIGKPCDVAALRYYMGVNDGIRKKIVYLISFFCAGIPSEDANKKLLNELKCDKCKELRYRGNGWPGLTTAIDDDGKAHTMEYEKSWIEILGRDIRKSCKFCFDGIGERADISCGDYWYLGSDNKPDFTENKGRNIVFAWTEKGEELLNKASAENMIHLDDIGDQMDTFKFVQPNHYSKRTTILSKVFALRFMRKSAPEYKTANMLGYAKNIPLLSLLKSFKGTVSRARKNTL